jgi:hypothetical protein
MTRREDLVALRDAVRDLLHVLDRPDQNDTKKGLYHYEWYRLDNAMGSVSGRVAVLDALIAQEPAPMTPVKDRGMHE